MGNLPSLGINSSHQSLEITCYLYVDSVTPSILDLGPNSSYHLVSINTCTSLKTHYFFIKTTSDNPWFDIHINFWGVFVEYRMEMLKIEHKGCLRYIYLAIFVMIRYTENYEKKFNS